MIKIINSLDEVLDKLSSSVKPNILNEENLKFSCLKIVVKGEDGYIYRLGGYDTLSTQQAIINYCIDKSITCFLPTEVVYKRHGLLLTKQESLDEVYGNNYTETGILSLIEQSHGTLSTDFLKDNGIFGLLHGNSGKKNNKTYIVDWMGGPIAVDDKLINWKGEILSTNID